jgi:uncharacterized repeat protein (TIGR01451 family)
MTRFFTICLGAVLLSLVFTIGIACAADDQGLQADLNISKVVSSTGPYQTDDEVTWIVTLWNNGPGNATNINVAEDLSGLTGLHEFSASTSIGDYNVTTNIWNIPELKNATSATLTLTTTFNTSGNKINNVTISGRDQTDPDLTANSATATVEIKEKEIIPPPGLKADLTISKTVSSSGPYNLQDNVTWVVTLQNKGPDNATNITVAEDLSGLTGLHDVSASASLGTYNSMTNIWNITELKNATSATLTITTTFSTAGKKINRVAITALNETDPYPDDHSANATVQYNTTESIPPDVPVSATLVIKPTTLNLKSKGVFTVYVALAGIADTPSSDSRNKPRIDYNNSSLTCGGAEMIRASVSNKDSGTLIAKFHRSDLENISSGKGVKINCSGTLVVNGKPINIEGSDTIRVIGEKKGLDKILSGLWKFLGVEKDDVTITEGEDGNITVTLSLNPDNFRNSGLAKKILKYEDNQSASRTGNETGRSDEIQKEDTIKNNGNSKQIRENNPDNETGRSDEIQKEDPIKNNGNSKQIRENNPDNKPGKGNNNKNDDESHGKSNGKKK